MDDKNNSEKTSVEDVPGVSGTTVIASNMSSSDLQKIADAIGVSSADVKDLIDDFLASSAAENGKTTLKDFLAWYNNQSNENGGGSIAGQGGTNGIEGGGESGGNNQGGVPEGEKHEGENGITKTSYSLSGKEKSAFGNVKQTSAFYSPSNATSSNIKYSSDKVVHLKSSEDFKSEVTDAQGFVFVDFYKGGCHNCVYSGWSMEQLARQNYAGVKYCNVQTFGSEYDPSSKGADLDWYLQEHGRDDGEFTEWMKNWLQTECNDKSERTCADEYSDATRKLDSEGIELIGGWSYPVMIMFKDGVPVGGIQGGQPYYDGDSDSPMAYMGGWDKIGMRAFINTCVQSDADAPATGWTAITQDVSPVAKAVANGSIREIPSKINVPDWFFGKFETERDDLRWNMKASFYATPDYIATAAIQPYQYLYDYALEQDGMIPSWLKDVWYSDVMHGDPGTVISAAPAGVSKEEIIDILDDYFDPYTNAVGETKWNYSMNHAKSYYGSKYQACARWGEAVPRYGMEKAKYDEGNGSIIYYILDASDWYVSVYRIIKYSDTNFSGSVFEVRKGGKFNMKHYEATEKTVIDGFDYQKGRDTYMEYGEFGMGGLMDWHYMWPYVYLFNDDDWRADCGSNANKTMTLAEVKAIKGE
ncbi:MAG TPA: hypothetical protein DCO86_01325 [Spirochaetaceae bacterium]|nr:hypothetical protein [Spirochaetaceae bacterium]